MTLRRRRRNSLGGYRCPSKGEGKRDSKDGWKNLLDFLSPELKDALWWLYNPLPINICTRGSAESLVVLLPVLATVAIADMYQKQQPTGGRQQRGTLPIVARACVAGIFHGIGIHAKLYPVIYTISFMANFSRQQQERELISKSSKRQQRQQRIRKDGGWRYLLSEQMELDTSKSKNGMMTTFPWTDPMQIVVLGVFWVQRLFFTLSSVLFLVTSIGTVGILTYLAVHFHGQVALEEGLLYHFQRVDHRHNYSMYWYWIYLARGRAEVESLTATISQSSSIWGSIPLLPQVLLLGFSSLGIAPYDLSFALFCQTFAFVAFNKVITAQYFTWYLCLLPLCSDRVRWNSKRMYFALGALAVSIVTWLLSAFSLEMLGWKSHRQVWMASLFFFLANVNLLRSILNGYLQSKIESEAMSAKPGEGWTRKSKVS